MPDYHGPVSAKADYRIDAHPTVTPMPIAIIDATAPFPYRVVALLHYTKGVDCTWAEAQAMLKGLKDAQNAEV
jgi:hypothetical protein